MNIVRRSVIGSKFENTAELNFKLKDRQNPFISRVAEIQV